MAHKKRSDKKIDSFLNKKISNRLSYTIISLVALILASVVVYAVVPNPGHPISAIEPPISGCLAGQFLSWTGSAWSCAAGSGGVGWAVSGNDIYNTNPGKVLVGAGSWGKEIAFNSANGPRIYGVDDATTVGGWAPPGDDALILHSGQGATFGQGSGLVRVIGNLLVQNAAANEGLRFEWSRIDSTGTNPLLLQYEGIAGKYVEIGSSFKFSGGKSTNLNVWGDASVKGKLNASSYVESPLFTTTPTGAVSANEVRAIKYKVTSNNLPGYIITGGCLYVSGGSCSGRFGNANGNGTCPSGFMNFLMGNPPGSGGMLCLSFA